MSAFAQTVTGDLDISTGNLVVRRDVAQVTAWKLSNLFAFFKGEWFRDSRLGVPYLQYVFISNPNLNLIGSLFQRVCRSAPGVTSVQSIDMNYVANLRTLSAQLKLTTSDGAILTGGPGQPFIIAAQAGG